MHIVYGIVYFLNSISCAALARVRVLTSVLCKVAGNSSANGFIGGSIVNAVIGAMFLLSLTKLLKSSLSIRMYFQFCSPSDM